MSENLPAEIDAGSRRDLYSPRPEIDMTEQQEMDRDFPKALEALINHHSQENGSDTPDFILAEYMMACLAAFTSTVRARDDWYGESKVEKLTTAG